VHRAVAGGRELPEYVVRGYDERISAAMAKGSGIVMVVGTSSSGRPGRATRRCTGLRTRERTAWRRPAGSCGRRCTRSIPGSSSTSWPRYWFELILEPRSGEPDPVAARLLLDGNGIRIADTFSEQDLSVASRSTDPRLAEAARQAEDAAVTQYLAEAPDLLQRYEMAEPGTRAVVHAAMDARRLGHGELLATGLLRAAEQLVRGAARGELKLTFTRRSRGRGDRDRDEPLLRRAVDAGDLDAFPHLVNLLESTGDRTGAEQLALRAVELGYGEAFGDLVVLREHGNPGEGQRMLDRLPARLQEIVFDALPGVGGPVETVPAEQDDPPGERALRLLEAGDHDAAEAVMLEATPSWPADLVVLLTLQNALERAGESARALEWAETIYDDYGDFGFGALRIAREEAGDLAGAEEVAVLAAERGATLHLWALAMVFNEHGDVAGAERCARLAISHGDTGERWVSRHCVSSRATTTARNSWLPRRLSPERTRVWSGSPNLGCGAATGTTPGRSRGVPSTRRRQKQVAIVFRGRLSSSCIGRTTCWPRDWLRTVPSRRCLPRTG
jgi:hypothetical protein